MNKPQKEELKKQSKKDGHCSFCCSHYAKVDGHTCTKKEGFVVEPEPEWVRQFIELDGSIPSKTQQKYIDFIRQLLAQARTDENEAWRRRERCSICGNPMIAKPLMDICDSCFETA